MLYAKMVMKHKKIVSSIYRDSYGCPDCKFSKESLARDIFQKIFKVNFYKKRKVFPEYKRLELDGINEEYNIAFEYDGIQHSKPRFGKPRKKGS